MFGKAASFLGGSMRGALGGAAVGGLMSGDMGGVIGGAVGGGLMGGMGNRYAAQALRGVDASKIVGGAAGMATRGMSMASKYAYKGAGMRLGKSGYGAAMMGAQTITRGRNAMANGAQWIGNNSVKTNKFAGKAAAAAGIGAGAYIGASAISSNRGY